MDAMHLGVMERRLCIHDEILLETPFEATNEVALTLKETMEDAEGLCLKQRRLRSIWLSQVAG
jgi:hypothetical protein